MEKNETRQDRQTEHRRLSEEEIRARRRKRRREQKLRKKRAVILLFAVIIVAVIALVLFFLGFFEHRSDVNRLTLKSNGSVIYEEIADMDDGGIDPDELKSYIRDQISEYNENTGSKAVRLKRFAVSDGRVYVRTSYESLDVYSDFTGYDAFSGTVSEAVKAGYDFSGYFTSDSKESGLYKFTDDAPEGYVSGDARILGTDGSSSVDDSDGSLVNDNVVIIDGTYCQIRVPGTLTGVSTEDTQKVDDSTISVEQDDTGDDSSLSEDAPEVYIFYK